MDFGIAWEGMGVNGPTWIPPPRGDLKELSRTRLIAGKPSDAICRDVVYQVLNGCAVRHCGPVRTNGANRAGWSQVPRHHGSPGVWDPAWGFVSAGQGTGSRGPARAGLSGVCPAHPAGRLRGARIPLRKPGGLTADTSGNCRGGPQGREGRGGARRQPHDARRQPHGARRQHHGRNAGPEYRAAIPG